MLTSACRFTPPPTHRPLTHPFPNATGFDKNRERRNTAERRYAQRTCAGELFKWGSRCQHMVSPTLSPLDKVVWSISTTGDFVCGELPWHLQCFVRPYTLHKTLQNRLPGCSILFMISNEIYHVVFPILHAFTHQIMVATDDFKALYIHPYMSLSHIMFDV